MRLLSEGKVNYNNVFNLVFNINFNKQHYQIDHRFELERESLRSSSHSFDVRDSFNDCSIITDATMRSSCLVNMVKSVT
jgi:hypothetical protein